MPAIALVSQKGGVSKTTSAVNLAGALRMEGGRVLVIDCDAQASASQWLLDHSAEEGRSVYDVLMQRAPVAACVERSPSGIDVLPSDIRMSSIDIDILPVFNRERQLAEGLAEVVDAYTWVLIDCPPSLGIASINALVAADTCVIPVDCRFQAMDAIPHLLKTIQRVSRDFKRVFRIYALPTFFQRTNMARDVYDEIQQRFESQTLSPVHTNIKLAEAYAARLTIFDYDSTANGAVDYMRVAKELEDELGPRKQKVQGSRRKTE